MNSDSKMGAAKVHSDHSDEQDKRALESEHQRQLDELYGEIGRLTSQLAWLKKKSGLEPGPR